jgi:hypothetical protein
MSPEVLLVIGGALCVAAVIGLVIRWAIALLRERGYF